MSKFVVFVVFLVTGIAMNFLPFEKEFTEFIGNADANRYIQMSKEIDLAELSEMNAFAFALGALNWFSLPLILKVIDIENGYFIMMLLNATILYGIVHHLEILSRKTIFSPALFISVNLLLMPFLWCWIFIPSKENITVLGFLCLFTSYQQNKKGFAYWLSLFLGLFKTQLIISLISTEALKRIRKRYFLLSLLAINLITICVYLFYEQALSVEQYLEQHADFTVNTSGIILFNENLIKIPVIGILAIFIRMMLYMPAGISAVKGLFPTLESFLMNFSSVAVGYLSIHFLFCMKRVNKSELKIFWSLLFVFLFVPFIQFRYFWWTIPIFLYFIVSRKPDYPIIHENKLARCEN